MIPSSRLTERVVDDLVLRPLTLSDAAVTAEVIRTAFGAQSKATRPPSSALRETEETVAAKIGAGGGFGALASGELVAVALWTIDKDALHVGRVSALSAHRGRGHARALIAACEQTARAHGVARMTLRTRLELPENERFFERLGFRRIGVETHDGFDAPTTAVMEKRLS
jgi:GNAT superfamily N-acetyltransferase